MARLAVCTVLIALFCLFSASSAQRIGGSATGGSASVAPNSPLGVICTDPELTQFCSLSRLAAQTDPVVAQLGSPNFVGTIFAPTDKGIANSASRIKSSLGVGLDNLPRNPADAARLIKNHIIIGQALSSPQLPNDAKFKSALGNTLEIDTGILWGTYVKGPRNTVTIVKKDQLAGNSYIHEVDGAIVPK